METVVTVIMSTVSTTDQSIKLIGHIPDQHSTQMLELQLTIFLPFSVCHTEEKCHHSMASGVGTVTKRIMVGSGRSMGSGAKKHTWRVGRNGWRTMRSARRTDDRKRTRRVTVESGGRRDTVQGCEDTVRGNKEKITVQSDTKPRTKLLQKARKDTVGVRRRTDTVAMRTSKHITVRTRHRRTREEERTRATTSARRNNNNNSTVLLLPLHHHPTVPRNRAAATTVLLNTRTATTTVPRSPSTTTKSTITTVRPLGVLYLKKLSFRFCSALLFRAWLFFVGDGHRIQ